MPLVIGVLCRAQCKAHVSGPAADMRMHGLQVVDAELGSLPSPTAVAAALDASLRQLLAKGLRLRWLLQIAAMEAALAGRQPEQQDVHARVGSVVMDLVHAGLRQPKNAAGMAQGAHTPDQIVPS